MFRFLRWRRNGPDYDKAVQDRTKLNQEVTQLQVYKQRYGELKQQMDALNKQLDTLKTIVPEEKEVDEFIRQVQGAASASNVQLRQTDGAENRYEGISLRDAV